MKKSSIFFWLAFVLLFNFIKKAQAETDAISNDTNSARPFSFPFCENERLHFCNDDKNLSNLAPCLIHHRNELSKVCQQDLERYLLFRNQTSSRGGGALSSFGGLNAMGPPLPLLSVDSRNSPGVSSPSFVENKFNVSAPVLKTEQETISLSLAGGDLHLGGPLTLNSGMKIPLDLYRVELGGQYHHPLADRKSWGLRGSVGSAGDAPFQNARDTTYSFNLNYGFPGSNKGYWLISIFFSNNSPLGNYVPFPGFDYLYKTDTFTGLFGFPVTAIEWTPIFPWAFSFGFFGPTLQTEVNYGSLDKIQFFSGFYLTRQSYLLSQRSTDLWRLSIQEMKYTLGIRSPIWSSALAELQLGRCFDRSLFLGNGLFNQDGGSLTLMDDWYASASLKFKL